MAASWRLNENIEKADARITEASETLGRYFPLSDALQLLRAAKHRNPLEQQLRQHEAFAAILEEVASHVTTHHEAVTEEQKEFKARLREAKREAKEANDEANALQSQLSKLTPKQPVKPVPAPNPAAPAQEAKPFPSSPASLPETMKPAGDK